MFLQSLGATFDSVGFPRIRGDVPTESQFENFGFEFSPHTRGCSVRAHRISIGEVVFPAYAGMFPSGDATGGLFCRFPRIRGDVPDLNVPIVLVAQFSPHTRGCS